MAEELFDESLLRNDAPAEDRPNGGMSFSSEAASTSSLTVADSKPLAPDNADAVLSPTSSVVTQDKRQLFKEIKVKCVLHVLLIETVQDLLDRPDVVKDIPPETLSAVLLILKGSYDFARKFNQDKELRLALFQIGFMKQVSPLLTLSTNLMNARCRI